MKSYIIPIFIPHYGCRHNCIFCNQRKITGRATPVTPEDVKSIIEDHLQRINQPRHIEVAFYGGSFTALPVSIQNQLLQPASELLERKRVHAIRLSTRPDCITKNILGNLMQFGVSTVELGVQSLDDHVLAAAERGHNRQDVFLAVDEIKKTGMHCGLQIMPGLPQEDWVSLVNTTRDVVALKPDFIRIYPTLVIANTPLADLYKRGEYSPLSFDEAIKRSAFLKLMCERNQIKVIRTGLQATTELSSSDTVLAGPYHPAFGEMVESYIFLRMIEQFIQMIPDHAKFVPITIHYHVKDHSKLRGVSNRNIKKLYRLYGIDNLQLKADGEKKGELRFEHNNISYCINKLSLKI